MDEILFKASITVVFGLVSGIAGIAIRNYFNGLGKRISVVEEDVKNLRENLPKEYVLKDDHYRDIQEIKNEIHKMREEIKEGFRRLEEKLERKADKQ